MSRVEAAAVMAMATANRAVDVVIYGQTNALVRGLRAASVLAGVDQVVHSVGSVGHATFGHTAIAGQSCCHACRQAGRAARRRPEYQPQDRAAASGGGDGRGRGDGRCIPTGSSGPSNQRPRVRLAAPERNSLGGPA